jgi:7,8-dihydropterin-6-yl-methyl-4-(beta-D-ribofuranosyl)aminobenzene 5'-phosphate synthase
MGIGGIASELGARNVPLLLHPDGWNRRRLTFETREPAELPTPSRSAIEGAGFEVIEERQPSMLLDGTLLITGEVDRTTDFERGMPNQQAMKGGQWVPDPLVSDDQALIANLRGRGLVVVTGCGHAGMVNILRHARRLTGIDEVYAAIGGFHLTGASEEVLGLTLAELATLAPEVVVPAHCTGWPATHLIAATFPGAFIQNSVGSRFELVAAKDGG